MNCCSNHTGSAQRCFGVLSKWYSRRYRRKGVTKQQTWMLDQLGTLGFRDASVLDIGCGVGVIHQTLLERGAARALGVDLSPAMLDLARERSETLGLTARVSYQAGDFVELQTGIEPADVTILDKVVCCYPNYDQLLAASSARTKRLIALVYPRRHLMSVIWNQLWNFGFWLFRSDFRGFIHEPAAVCRSLETRGFKRTFNRNSFLWHTQVFVTEG